MQRLTAPGELCLIRDSASIVSHSLLGSLVQCLYCWPADLSGDQDQVLYGSCTGSEPGCGPCGSSVPDFLLNQPLCSKHVTKAVSYQTHHHASVISLSLSWQALETIVQQQKRKNTASNTSKLAKTKGKGQKNKKTKAAAATVTKVVAVEFGSEWNYRSPPPP